MSRHHFMGIDRETHQCLFPEGQDPLLASWRRGETETHPGWFDLELFRRTERDAEIHGNAAKNGTTEKEHHQQWHAQ